MTTLGDAIRAARLRAGLTQAALAWRLDLKSASIVSQWESNRCRPRPKNLRAIWEICGTRETFPQESARAPDASWRIRRAREAAGLSRRQLARAVGVSASSVTYWECGDRRPTTAHLVAVVKVCGVTPEWFWDPAARDRLGTC